MKTRCAASKRPCMPAKKGHCGKYICARELGKRHESDVEREGTGQIAHLARSIGFSMREASEIEKIYRSTPDEPLK